MQSRWQERNEMPGKDGAHVVGGGVALPLDAARSGA